MAGILLDLLGTLDVDVGDVGLEFGQLGGGDETGRCLRRRQRQPDLAHQPPLVDLGPDLPHVGAAIAPRQGG